MAKNNETAQVTILINAKAANASINDLQRASIVLRNQIKKLPTDTQEFINKSKELQEINSRLEEITNGVKQTSTAMQDAGKQFTTMFGAMSLSSIVVSGIGQIKQAITQFLSESWNKFLEAEAAAKRLTGALNGNEMAADRVTEAALRMSRATAIEDDAIISMQTYAINLGKSEAQTQELLTASMNLAAVQGDMTEENIRANMEMLVGIENSGKMTKQLPKLNGEFKKLTAEQMKNGDVSDMINQLWGGKLNENITTMTGKIQAASNEYGNLQESVGGVMAELMESMGVLTAWTDNLTRVNDAINSETLPAFEKMLLVMNTYSGEMFGNNDLIIQMDQMKQKTQDVYMQMVENSINMRRQNGQSMEEAITDIKKYYQNLTKTQLEAGEITWDLPTTILQNERIMQFNMDMLDKYSQKLSKLKDLQNTALTNAFTGNIKDTGNTTKSSGGGGGKKTTSRGKIENIASMGGIKGIPGSIENNLMPDAIDGQQALENSMNYWYERNQMAVKQMYMNGVITQDEMNRQIQAAEIAHLEAMYNLKKQFGENTFTLEQQILDKKLALFEAEKAAADQKAEAERAAREAEIESAVQSGMAIAEQAESVEEAGRQIINAIRQEIKAQIAKAVAATVAKTVATVPFPGGLILGMAAGAATSALFDQVIPAFKDGRYPDLQAPKTGLYTKPTLGLFSEVEPEIVIDGKTTKNMQLNYPWLLQAIDMVRVRPYAQGNYPDKVMGAAGGGMFTDLQMLAALSKIYEQLQKPARSYVVYEDIKDAGDTNDIIVNSVTR